jgi:RNA polymerase sigma-70 factor (ECF subfamily)
MSRAGVSALRRAGPETLDIESVYRDYCDAVTRWAARLSGPAIETEDLVQEIFLIAHRKLASFRHDAALATWLYRITERVVSRRRRREQLRRWLMRADARAGLDTVSPAPTPLESLQRRRAIQLTYRALEALNENQRSAFILFEIEELSGQEIAELKGVSVSTVWVWLHRARARFLARLAELEGEGLE